MILHWQATHTALKMGGGNATIEIKHVNCSTSLDIEYTQLRIKSACELADNSDVVTSLRQTCKEKDSTH